MLFAVIRVHFWSAKIFLWWHSVVEFVVSAIWDKPVLNCKFRFWTTEFVKWHTRIFVEEMPWGFTSWTAVVVDWSIWTWLEAAPNNEIDILEIYIIFIYAFQVM